jgi:hypothetical protein
VDRSRVGVEEEELDRPLIVVVGERDDGELAVRRAFGRLAADELALEKVLPEEGSGREIRLAERKAPTEARRSAGEEQVVSSVLPGWVRRPRRPGRAGSRTVDRDGAPDESESMRSVSA